MADGPFRPTGLGVAGTVSIAAAAASGRVAILTGHPQYEIYNSGSTGVAVCFGDSSVAATVPNGATAGSYVVGPGQCKLVSLIWAPGSAAPTNMAAILLSGSTAATVYVTAGQGLS